MNVRIPKDEDIHIANTKDIARIMRKILLRQNRLHRKKEYFWAIGLSTNHDIEYIELLTIGTLNQNNVDPVEVFSFAVSKKCKKLIICHNHPSGNLQPSESDLELTRKIAYGAHTLNIKLLDHIIIDESKEYTSMFGLDILEVLS
ncbi:JAB domain-containing protein [Flavobacterium salilacus subsp. salilacus]|uniref:JAB domain-containing protein n=1 Tax=Flavobacterium TaxID=237 RepID=UPI0010753F3D|nr:MULTISPECIES: JAB domain-containing protein [Flavobacterium]KAF2515839.1 JAB domain-containing protein [Flavobacterium salilacus subsp. salilacus]MBE1615356.1 JAB domain-containing protein [Flavobacterium sp. SaA2.13]